MKIRNIKIVFGILGICFVLLSSCSNDDNIQPLPDPYPEISKANIPLTSINGLNIRASVYGYARADTANFYLRPVAGGDDINLRYGSNFRMLELNLITPRHIDEGEYHLILKRPNGELTVERSEAPAFGSSDDWEREPVTTNAIYIWKPQILQDDKVLAKGQELIIKGGNFLSRDSIYIRTHLDEGEDEWWDVDWDPSVPKPTARLVALPILEKVQDEYFRVAIPNNLPTENIGFNDIILSRSPDRTVIGTLWIKDPINIQDVKLPAGTVNSGDQVFIQCVGCHEGDKIVLRSNDHSQREVIDAVVSPSGIGFIFPATFQDTKLVKIGILRSAELPLFDLGYITTGAGDPIIIDIPSEGYGSIPDKIPAGYPYLPLDSNLETDSVKLSLTLVGSGFSPGDSILFGENASAVSIMGNKIQFELLTEGLAEGNYDMKLKRNNGNISTLKNVQVVNAPRIGDFAEGGIVFYIDPIVPTKGLVVSIIEASGKLQWGNEYKQVSMNKDIYSGKENTDIIIAAYGQSAGAANWCKDLVSFGKDDWWLPSRNEIDQIRLKRKPLEARLRLLQESPTSTEEMKQAQSFNADTPTKDSPGYASSTQELSFNVYCVSFYGGGNLQTGLMDKQFYVRAIREF